MVSTNRKRFFKLWAGLALSIALLTLAVMTIPALKNRARGLLIRAGIIPPALPTYLEPIAPADRVTARRLVVANLHQALAKGDYQQAAMFNAILSQEAFQHAYQTLNAWETARQPATGLIPYATARGYDWWNGKDVAADLFAHFLIASILLDHKQELWLDTLNYEYKACGALACRLETETGNLIEEDLDTLIFATSEYAKDGLLAITERYGAGPWLDRMIAGTDAVLEAAYFESRYGLLPSNGTETNGELLQVLTRLYWLTKDEAYLEMAERIGDAYLLEILPNNNGLPADYWDFSAHVPLREDERFRPAAEQFAQSPLRLVDHGGEIIPGLAELYFLEKVQNRPKADQYQEPLQNFLDLLLETGRTKDGLWYESVDVNTGEPLSDNLADTWGYILNAYHTFDLAEGTDTYTPEIEWTMMAVTKMKSIEWEGQLQDGYADSIESMLYMLPWFNLPEAHQWVDDEIEVMFLKQNPNGFVEGWYLDGNFVRTALLYALYKTQGVSVSPWQETIQLGAVLDNQENTLYLYLSTQKNWQGDIMFDFPRHRLFWDLPFEYPRLNSLPEWYTVEPEGSYLVINLHTGEEVITTGQQLIDGLAISLAANEVLQLAISKQ